MFIGLYIVLLLAIPVLSGQNLTWTATPFNPPSIPLAVRSPYLSAWLPQGQGHALNDVWPVFWDGSILGWAGYIRVDSTVYNWLGVPSIAARKAIQKSSKFTSTQSIFVLQCGSVDLTATFLSPIEPTNLVNLSVPFSYVALSVASNDGLSHSVQVYMDISAEWLIGQTNAIATWSTTVGNVITHQMQLQNSSVLTETANRIQYGAAYFSTVNSAGTTYQADQDIIARTTFVANGTLGNSQNLTFRGVGNNWPVFALAQDMGTINAGNTASAVYSVGYSRDNVVESITASGTIQYRNYLFLSNYPQVTNFIPNFLSDYPDALNRANTFDNQVLKDAVSISSDASSSDYAALVALSVRQLFGSLEITVSPSNTSDILIFMRGMDGAINAVDMIFSAWPAFLYFNPAILKYLLLPHYIYQSTGRYPNKWAAHDLGAYPKAIGNPNDTVMPIEESGNQLIMALSYTQKTNDMSLISSYSSLLDQWAQYLLVNSLIPTNQLSTDAFAGTLVNQTNLAIKGIVGIRAAAEIWKLLGNAHNSSMYNSSVSIYVKNWQQMAYSSDQSHLTLSYGDNPSWGLMYNLYADRLLNTHIFNESIYETQTAWYKQQAQPLGIPLDSRNTYTKTDWQMWIAATVTDPALRNSIIGFETNYLTSGVNSDPLPDWYETKGAKSSGFKNRPVVGGHLALLLVNGVPATASSNTTSPGNTTPSAANEIHSSAVFYLMTTLVIILLDII